MRLKTLSRQKQRSRGNRNPPNDEILTFTDDTAEKTGMTAIHNRPLWRASSSSIGRLCQLSTFLLLASNQLPV
jgi:hypothetical protein